MQIQAVTTSFRLSAQAMIEEEIKMTKKDNMQIAFITALLDVFRDEDKRELDCMPKVDIEYENGNDLILAMFYAVQYVYNIYSGQKDDPLAFISVLTRLLFQER